MAVKDKTKVTLFLDPEIIKMGKAYALNEGKSLSEVVENLLKDKMPKTIKISVEK